MKVRFVVRRERTADTSCATQGGFRESQVGTVKHSKRFVTRELAQREADAWTSTGEWDAEVVEVTS